MNDTETLQLVDGMMLHAKDGYNRTLDGFYQWLLIFVMRLFLYVLRVG
ncbi:MAG: hypothetical protein LBH43_08810 [Treponema sp.]|jgi:hypothetical protein|nr:hypothetical protein [Treponema sp.]